MAKQENKHKQVKQQPKKPAASSDNSAFTYLWRNLLITGCIVLIYLIFASVSEKDGRLPELYQEFQQLRQTGRDQARLEDLYNEIMAIQSDTSFVKRFIRGYYWATHDVAIQGSEYVQELEDKANKPITRDDKFAMRVGVWPIIEEINKVTPPDAVIYLPKGDSALSNNSKWSFIYSSSWMEYFIYPRLCLTIGTEKDHPDLAQRAKYVVIVQGKGYEKLKYDVPMNMHIPEAVLPIDHPPTKNQ